MQILNRPVQNYARSRQGYKPEAIVIHVAEGDTTSAWDKFNNSLLRNSTHYLITQAGEVWRLVEETDTAWHAGGVNKPAWTLLKPGINPNLYTIGITFEGYAGEPWSDLMYERCSQLVAAISARWDIPADRQHIVSHSQINALRNDPGLAADIHRIVAGANDIYPDGNQAVKPADVTDNRLAALQLSLSAAETENAKLHDALAETSHERQEQLQRQNLNFSEELYKLQQQHNDLKVKFQTLQNKCDTLASQHLAYLSQFSTSELVSAIIKRIFRRK